MPLPANYVTNRGVVIGGGKRVIAGSAVVHDTFTNPAAVATTGISASHTGASGAGTTNMTIGGTLASGGVVTLSPARNVVITVTHATAVVAMSGTITGTDAFGRAQTEDWSVAATGTTKTFTGTKGFATVTSITETVAADASANTVIAGTGSVLLLSAMCSVAKILAEVVDGSVVTTGAITAGEDGVSNGTYTPATAPNGTHDYAVWYISDFPETSVF